MNYYKKILTHILTIVVITSFTTSTMPYAKRISLYI